MIDVSVQLDARTQATMQRALERVIAVSPRSVRDCVYDAGWNIARSVKAGAKPGAKKRETEPSPIAKGLVNVTVLRQGKPPKRVLMVPKNDPIITIKTHGLARRVWGAIMGKIAAGKDGEGTDGKDSGKYASVWKGGPKDNPMTRFYARLSYMLTAYPGIGENAIKKGITAFVARWDREFGGKIKREFEAA